MTSKKTQYLLAAVIGLHALASHAAVVNFEDLTQWNAPSDGYGGISGWSELGSVGPSFDGPGLGSNVFYGVRDGEIRFDSAPVVFEGVFYKSYAADWQNPITSVSLFYQGQLVQEILDPLAPQTLVWLASGYSGLIDKIVFRGGGEGFAIDNLSYSRPTSQVPLPSAIPFMLTGLGMLGYANKSRARVRRQS